MDVPWWVWIAVVAWCGPGVLLYYLVVTTFFGPDPDPISRFRIPEPDEPPRLRPPTGLRKVFVLVLVFVVMITAWPFILWREGRSHAR
jgi:hypothetical protein